MADTQSNIFGFLATVDNVYGTTTELLTKEQGEAGLDSISVYNDNKTFSDKDARMYGAITYRRESNIKVDDYAFPFDKNLKDGSCNSSDTFKNDLLCSRNFTIITLEAFKFLYK